MERALGSRYRLGSRLGAGAMGEVFLGADSDGREFAFKILRPDLTADPGAVARFLQERSILVRLRHPNLVGVHDLVAEGETVGIVMDLVPGGDLRRALTTQGPLLPAEVARIGAGIASGLAMVHEAGVVHRDVKPENVLLDDSEVPPTPRLTDFGFSRLVSSTDTGRSTLMVGTPLYVAPELVDGAEPTPAADLYALGIVLYEMCCGVTPFAGGSMLTVLRRHAEMTAGRPEGIPDQLWDMINWLLAKSPRGRPQSARQVATVLDALVADLRGAPVARGLSEPPPPLPSMHNHETQGVAPVTTGSTGVARPAPRSRRGRLAVAGIAVLALLVAGGWVVSRSGGSGSDTAAAAAAPTTTGGAPTVTANATDGASPTDVPSPTSGPGDATGPAPKLVGRQLADATGLLPSSVRLQSTDTVDEKASDGTILSQDPAPGAPMNGTMKVTVARQPVLTYLDSLEPVNNQWDYAQAMELSGKVFPHSVANEVRSCNPGNEVEYNISRGYRKLVATAGLDDNGHDDSLKMQLELFADGRRVSVTKVEYGKTTPLAVDVTGVLRLKFQWQPVAGSPNCESDQLVLGTGRLLGLPGEVPQSTDSPTDDPNLDTSVDPTDTPTADPTG
jgi:serine/threonine protein kinase